jgi:hypothetical protein
MTGEIIGFHRGIVVQNNDPEYKGRVKVFVPGVHGHIGEFKFDVNFLSEDVTGWPSDDILHLQAGLPWTPVMHPVFGMGTSGYRYPNDKVSDFNPYEKEEIETDPKPYSKELESPPKKKEKRDPRYNMDATSLPPDDSWTPPEESEPKPSTEEIKRPVPTQTQPPSRESEKKKKKKPEIPPIDLPEPPYKYTQNFPAWFKHKKIKDGGDTRLGEINQPMYSTTHSGHIKGMISIPSFGAHVWVFFEGGDREKPVVIGTHITPEDFQNMYEIKNPSK